MSTVARSVIGKAFAFLVAGLVALTLLLVVVLPTVVGGQAYTILTGSMRPGMPPGTLVVVRPTPTDEIRVGDVVTYQLRSGQPTVATHRVVEIGTTLSGEVRFTTKGDDNAVADSRLVRPVQIRGTRWYDVPYLGYPAAVIDHGTRGIVILGAVAVLLAYAGACLVGSVRDARKRRQAESTDTTSAEQILEPTR